MRLSAAKLAPANTPRALAAARLPETLSLRRTDAPLGKNGWRR